MKCSGYERIIAFKDVSDQAAESSRKFEAARWAALRAEDERARRMGRVRTHGAVQKETTASPAVETLSSDAEDEAEGNGSSSSSFGHPESPFPSTTSSRRSRRHPQSINRPRQSLDYLPLASDSLELPLDPILNETPNFDTFPSFDADPEVRNVAAEGATGLAVVRPDYQEPTTLRGSNAITTHAQEVALIEHFESQVQGRLPVPMKFGSDYMENSCFRQAILALASTNQAYLEVRAHPTQPIPIPQLRRSAVGREHYLAAVSELYRRLDLSDPVSRKYHAAAALILAYYEIETGSPHGSLQHARGLDALLSRMDISPSPLTGSMYMPEIFKAWRLLRYDVRHITAPYRESIYQRDIHDNYAALDPQLAIRDAYTMTFQLYNRATMEASFTPSPAKGSASRQAALWIREVGNRMADRRNIEKGDINKDSLTPEEVLRRVEKLTCALDAWHAALSEGDMPVVKLGSASPFVSSGRSRSFEPFPVLGFSAGDRTASEYMMYVTARLIICYLMSVYGGEQSSSAAETATWATTLMGIVCGMQQKQKSFTYVNTADNVLVAAILCEGTSTINAVLDGVIPYVLNGGIRQVDLAEWLYAKKALEICRRERARGRAIRFGFLTLDENYEMGNFDTACSIIAFGDYNGKGHFRDVIHLNTEPFDSIVVGE